MHEHCSRFPAIGLICAGFVLGACSDTYDVRGAVGIGPGLPTAYPLLPGDEALWAGMTVAQKQRALLFLEDGSTIASSLKAD